MDLGATIWIYIPILIGLFEIIWSIYLTSKKKKTSNYIFSSIILISNILAIVILIEILIGSWPSYIPHILITISTILIIIQYLISMRKKKRLPTPCKKHCLF